MEEIIVCLRHELTHTNDLKHGENIVISDYEPQNIKDFKNALIEGLYEEDLSLLEVIKHPFIIELRNAGVPENYIMYGIN